MHRTTKITFLSTSALVSVTTRLCVSCCRATLTCSLTPSTSTGTHRCTCKWFTVSVASCELSVNDMGWTWRVVLNVVSSGPAIMESLQQWRRSFNILVQKVFQRRTYSVRQYFTGIVHFLSLFIYLYWTKTASVCYLANLHSLMTLKCMIPAE